MKLFRFACAATAVAVAASFARAEDWHQYRGNQGDGKSTESIGDSLNVVWTVPAPLGFSSFAIADGRAFTVIGRDEKETLVAMDASNGKELWAVPMGSSAYEQGGGGAGTKDNRGGDGPRSTPLVDDGRVYVYDSYMLLQCFDAATGKLVWKRDVIKEYDGRNISWLNATSPVIAGDLVIVGGGGAGKSFLAFEKTTGKNVWESGDETITHATPTVAKGDGGDEVIFFAKSGLVSVDANSGKELWRAQFPFSTSTAASPVTDGDLVYCSAGYGVGAGVFKKNGTAIADEVWFKSNELMNHWSTPVVHDGHLYGLFEFKKYGTAPLQCVELATGEIKWAERGFGPGNCILAGDKLVVLSDAGEVAIVKADPSGYHELARKDVLTGKCWSMPAISDGKVFVRSTEQAACIAVD
ncbi:PQQ-binding-like beta-propeller repeat protein [Rubripirellula reticaptiva]|uniref:Quinoprotein ethanol dehydrogenase n=1 Tax=Rubripirellula reticaptiva TaxID=2528013 RepID=A0A5C6EJE3_9BACT|nr:PQQ-binding-like beta-propeller repeat protein [Rubripirellula reticaptiva]TWU47791.1 Quinoprotein ethanol dehydrogenase precursor [Rubripirellula reticaptiva]